MDFTILGTVSAGADGRPVPLDGSKQRAALAALLLAEGARLPQERLTALLWGWDPPATSTNQLYTYMSRLRTRLGPGVILKRTGPGYHLDIGGSAFDWADFRRRAETGRADLRAGRYAEAERQLADALALWRGPALTDVTEELARAEGPRLEESRLAVREGWYEASLALGRHHDTVPGLTRLVTAHPVRERLRGQLMTALYRCGRQADALAVYEEGRRALADDLGIDTGLELRGLHQEILRGTLAGPAAPEPASAGTLVPPAAPAAVAAAAVPAAVAAPASPAARHGGAPDAVPAQLPAAPGDFTGRGAETTDILDALRGHRDVVVTGAPGTGKSALALRAAERCRGDFPDGSLYADLRGPDGARPREPGEVLRGFLYALGTAPQQIPASLDERAQLYRTLLAKRRALIVLDNAADDAQVRPLLPGVGPSRAVVTGVHATLASLEGARLVWLDAMAPGEAGGLLAAIAGDRRLTDDPEAAALIAEYCDLLPLALRIAGARLAAHPHLPAGRLAARLAREEIRLDELRLGGLDVRAALRTAADSLDSRTTDALGRLAAAAGPAGMTAREAAALLGILPGEAEAVLDRLADARLADVLPGTVAAAAPAGAGDPWPRYRFSPLVRLFAGERRGSVPAPAVPPPVPALAAA